MRFLVITQDLRVSGTSAGIGRRSFLVKLKKTYPNSVIDLFYISNFAASKNDELVTLPVDSIIRKTVNNRIPYHIKWLNRVSTRMFDFLYAESYIHQKYAKHIKQIDHRIYNHIFIWSSGINHETILASHDLPILKKAIVIFHDPYPLAWYKGMSSKIHKNEFLRLRKMISVVQQSKSCCATAYYMAKDLQYLYASKKFFHTLPHCFEVNAFKLDRKDNIRGKKAKCQIAYHGALMFGRNMRGLLDAYSQLIEENETIKKTTEFVLRVKGENVDEFKTIYKHNNNIHILDPLDFSNSFNEQLHESDINIILENGPYYSNILPGKVPLLANLGKPVFILSPLKSELRRITENPVHYIADMNNIAEIKEKLKDIILRTLKNESFEKPFGNYFSDENFINSIQTIINIDYE